jgi:DNA-binding SARP family transcriptional activator
MVAMTWLGVARVDSSAAALHLLNGPYVVRDGDLYAVPEGGKRLLVLLAVRGCISRRTAAEMLWPNVEMARAAGNLRSASWRLRCAGITILSEHADTLRLDDGVQLDVEMLCRQARRISAGQITAPDLEMLPVAAGALDLLPGWYEEWVVVERERVRCLMLDAIDAISAQLRRVGRCAEAIEAALVAVTADPLRDSAQAALVAAHLAEGNLCEARRAFSAYRRLLRAELGLEPPEALAQLVHSRQLIRNGPRLQQRPAAVRAVRRAAR